jgi:hypothetical protein
LVPAANATQGFSVLLIGEERNNGQSNLWRMPTSDAIPGSNQERFNGA